MTEQPPPPPWADALLRIVLRSADRERVSGDLLEEYRDAIVPARGRLAADRWYVRQVAGYVWRQTWPWAVIFSAAYLARTAYDWRVPTTDFLERAQVTTIVAGMTLTFAGFWTACRSGSIAASVMIVALTTQVAALLSIAGVTLLLAAWHDPETLRTIAGSGGLSEAYTLPFLAILPAIVVGLVSGTVGHLAHRFR
jgi:hypothetical protein